MDIRVRFALAHKPQKDSSGISAVYRYIEYSYKIYTI